MPKIQIKYWISISIFIIFIFAPGVKLLSLTKQEIKQAEKKESRVFSRFPKINFSKFDLDLFLVKFEKFINDHIGYRQSLEYYYSKSRYWLFGISPTTRIIRGKSGWFYTGIGRERINNKSNASFDLISEWSGKNLLNQKQLLQWKKVLEERQEFFAKNSTKFIFSIAPIKQDIYPEYLPGNLADFQATNRRRQLCEYLNQQSKVPCVDLAKALLDYKATHPETLLYLKTDSHWNEIGALVAYQALLSKAQELFPQKKLDALNLATLNLKYNPNFKHNGFAGLLGFPITEPRPLLTAKESTDFAQVRVKVGGDKEGMRTRVLLNPVAKDFNSILILGDSFIEKSTIFFAKHSSRTTYFRSITTDFSKNHISKIPGTKNADLAIQTIYHPYIVNSMPSNN